MPLASVIQPISIQAEVFSADLLSKCHVGFLNPTTVLCSEYKPLKGQKSEGSGWGSKGPLSPFNWSKMGLSNIIHCPTENYCVVHPCDCYPHRPHTWIFMNINPDHTIDGYSSSDNSLWISMFIFRWLFLTYWLFSTY